SPPPPTVYTLSLHDALPIFGERGHHGEPDVRQRADGERDPLAGEPRHQLGVLQASHAVVDPAHPQQVERLPDVLGRPFLAGVREDRKSTRLNSSHVKISYAV